VDTQSTRVSCLSKPTCIGGVAVPAPATMAIDFQALRAKLKAEMAAGAAISPQCTTAGSAGAAEISDAPASATPQARAAVAEPANVAVSLHLPSPLEAYAVGSVPTVHYVPDVLSPADAALLVACVDHAAYADRWLQLKKRRLQNWGGTPTWDDGLRDAEPLPLYLAVLADRLVASGVFPSDKPPNHVLVNDYAAGQGILPHTDGPAYWPQVATVSLLSSAIMRYSLRADGARVVQEVVLRPRSMVVTSGEAYHNYMHSIGEEMEERVGATGAPLANAAAAAAEAGELIARDRRVSLTLRHVPARRAAAATAAAQAEGPGMGSL
jgi:alkylated DNA repair protein alkB family protein 6